MVEVIARYEPNPEHKAVYDHGYEIYKKMQTDCAQLFEMVNQ